MIALLGERGVAVDTVPEALEKLAREGFGEVFVQPSLLIRAIEYDQLAADCAPYTARFSRFSVGRPLLSDEDDLHAVARIELLHNPTAQDEALLLFGHGTAHSGNAVYAAFESVCRAHSRRIFVCTVEGDGSARETADRLRAAGYTSACIAPLLLVAGDHVKNDMAADTPDSWKTRLTACGVATRANVRGLGEYPETCELLCEHLARAMEAV